MHTAPATTTCPAYCTRVHSEEPGEIVIHETVKQYIDQIPEPRGPRQTLLVQVSQADDDMTPRLHLGSYDLDLAGAEELLAAVAAKVLLMRSLHNQAIAGAR